MNYNITKETEIYQLLLDDSLYDVILDGEHYTNYIIYTDYRGIKYRIFIHDNLLHHNIKFYVDTTSIKDKLIALSFAEDVPLYILYEDNDHDENNLGNYVVKTTSKIPDVVGDEDDSNDYEAFEYENILLKYNSLSNIYYEYIDGQYKTYKIYTKESTKINEIIRHFKVIKVRFYDYTDVINKYCLYFTGTNKLYNWYTSYNKAINAYNEYITKYGNNLYIVNEGLYIKDISQDPTQYGDKLYCIDGFSSNNMYKNATLQFNRYYTVNELKNKLYNENSIATYSYINKITEDNVETNDILNNIDYDLNNSDYFYIRFAPSPDMKYTQAKRVFQIRHIFTDYNDEEHLNILVQKSEMPIYNDNLIYSQNKCNIVDDRLNLNMID